MSETMSESGDQNQTSHQQQLDQTSHEHAPGCGHTMIFHDDHVGFFMDGVLMCRTDPTAPMSMVQHEVGAGHADIEQASSGHHSHGGDNRGHSHGGDNHGHSHGGDNHGHSRDGDSHGHSHGGDSRGHSHGGDNHGHSHSGGKHGHSRSVVDHNGSRLEHQHDDSCGHERVWHNGHFDYLVGDKLTQESNLLCGGSVKRYISREDVFQAVTRKAATSPVDLSPQQRRELSSIEELELSASENILRLLADDQRWYRDSNMRRFVAMVFLTGSYFVVELVVGFGIGSLALVSDAFHMFSDLLGLFIGFASLKLSRKNDTLNTFRYARAEVVGALVNAVFLLSVCLMITMEAIERLIQREHGSDLEENGPLLLIVAGIGLLMNILGLVIFGHGHGHSHGGHSHTGEEENLLSHGHSHEKSRNMNVHGVFLHILGDALGSVAAIVSGLVIWLSDSEYRTLADPLCTLVISGIIMFGTIPLVKQALPILLDSVPNTVNLSALKRELEEVKGVVAIHELHVWSISPSRTLGSVHVHMARQTDLNVVLIQMKMICHKHTIHTTTIQAELSDTEKQPSCVEPYCGSPQCLNAYCCVPLDRVAPTTVQ